MSQEDIPIHYDSNREVKRGGTEIYQGVFTREIKEVYFLSRTLKKYGNFVYEYVATDKNQNVLEAIISVRPRFLEEKLSSNFTLEYQAPLKSDAESKEEKVKQEGEAKDPSVGVLTLVERSGNSIVNTIVIAIYKNGQWKVKA